MREKGRKREKEERVDKDNLQTINKREEEEEKRRKQTELLITICSCRAHLPSMQIPLLRLQCGAPSSSYAVTTTIANTNIGQASTAMTGVWLRSISAFLLLNSTGKVGQQSTAARYASITAPPDFSIEAEKPYAEVRPLIAR